MDVFSKKINIENLISKDALEARKDGLEVLIHNAKEDLSSYEEQLKAIVSKLKDFASSTAEIVQDKTEEAVEAVKEEAKKAAPKRTTKKAAAKAEEKVEEAEESDKNSDK